MRAAKPERAARVTQEQARQSTWLKSLRALAFEEPPLHVRSTRVESREQPGVVSADVRSCASFESHRPLTVPSRHSVAAAHQREAAVRALAQT